MSDFKEQMTELIKACGQELIERAEDLIGNGELVSDFSIWIRFPSGGMPLVPTIEVSREYVCKNAMSILKKKG